MKLFFQKMGQGQPIIILHGLYGSSDNWITIARQISNHYQVYLVDQRNHGKSPHCQEHSYMDMAGDIYDLVQSENLKKIILIGHSMGGKTAMLFAGLHPDRLTGMVIVDIGPGSYINVDNYSPQAIAHLNIMNSMRSVDFARLSGRVAIDSELSVTIPDIHIRQFILKNVLRNQDNSFRWKLNIEALSNALPDIMGSVHLDQVLGVNVIDSFPILFFKGELSDYIDASQEQLIHTYFPGAKIKVVPNAGHWVHADETDFFLNRLEEFLSQV